MHQTSLDLPEGASPSEKFALMLHERLIVSEEKLVTLQNEVWSSQAATAGDVNSSHRSRDWCKSVC